MGWGGDGRNSVSGIAAKLVKKDPQVLGVWTIRKESDGLMKSYGLKGNAGSYKQS